MTGRQNKNLKSPGSAGSREPRGKQVQHPQRRKTQLRMRYPLFLEVVLRWGLVVIVFCVLATSISAGNTARANADHLAAELTELERERSELQAELDLLNDPEWRESYWKWRTMSHEPGEYYIEFLQPGSL